MQANLNHPTPAHTASALRGMTVNHNQTMIAKSHNVAVSTTSNKNANGQRPARGLTANHNQTLVAKA